MKVNLPAGVSTGVGSLPHRDAVSAARWSFDAVSLPFVPSLPRRSPAEGMIAQAVVGVTGVSLGPYGSLAVDVALVDPASPVTTDLRHDAFGGVRAFVAEAQQRAYTGPVKWQLTGPVTLGLALQRAGVPASVAFEVAIRSVQQRASYLLAHLERELPGVVQVVVLDEPGLVGLQQSQFPLAPDVAIDLVSGALAVIEPRALAGLHCCGDVDVSWLLAAGPGLISLPVSRSLAPMAGYLTPFLERGGVVAWGAVPTDGPVPHSVERPWRALNDLWGELVEGGCDPTALRVQSMITPACGLGMHSPQVASSVMDLVRQIERRVTGRAVVTGTLSGA